MQRSTDNQKTLNDMAKELPFFKFFPGEWVTGDVTMVSMEAQGVFTNLCCYYWMRNCSISIANAKQRFSNHLSAFEELLNWDVVKVTDDGQIVINFLDEQMNEFINVSEKRAKAGSAGGKAKAKQLLNFAVANHSYKDKEKEEDKDNIGGKSKRFIPPTLEEVTAYCKERNNGIDPVAWWNFYNSKNWMVGKNKMTTWRSAIVTWERKNGLTPTPPPLAPAKPKKYREVSVNGEVMMEAVDE